MTYDIGNPGSGLGQAQKCGGVKRFIGSQPSPLDNWIKGNPYINKW
jgi:hypothetical protein